MTRNLLLAAVLVLSATFAVAANTATAVHTFTCKGDQQLRIGTCPQGGRPDALIQGSDGNFYGAAQDSMEGSSTPNGGTVFSVTPAGTFKLLHTFAPGANNDYPNGNFAGQLIEGPDGRLYGVTLFGGINGCSGYCGYGVLYRLNRDGSGFKIIHKFCSEANCADGWAGYTIVKGNDGNLYGTTYYGGTGSGGTIFRVTPSTGTYEVVLNFDFYTTGENPSALVVAPDGTFYGSSVASTGDLLLHYVEDTGTFTTVVLNFSLFNGLPSAGTVSAFGPNGNIYGLYGIYGRSGEGLFEVETDGSNLQLFPFYTTVDGAGEPGGMFLASDGNFWIFDIVADDSGDIISLSPSNGSLLQTLTPFSNSGAVGAYPLSLMQAKDGTLWGTAEAFGYAPKGYFGDGTVFSLDAGLPAR
jgi:uncharacterized repeat protein (TIGR03803 family)